MNRSEWIAQARLSFRPGDREPCEVCGKFRQVAEAHHIVPLGQQFDAGRSEPDHSHAWLCPTHHAVVHVALDTVDIQLLGRRFAGVMDDLSEDELRKVLALLNRARDAI